MHVIKSLCLEQVNLSSLSGFDNLVNLEMLFLGNNHIASLSEIFNLKNLFNLTILDLSGNKICHEEDYRNFVIYHICINIDQKLLNYSGSQISNQLQPNSTSDLTNLAQLKIAANNTDSNSTLQTNLTSTTELWTQTNSINYANKIINENFDSTVYVPKALQILDNIYLNEEEINNAKDMFGGRLTIDSLNEYSMNENGTKLNLNPKDRDHFRKRDREASVNHSLDRLVANSSKNLSYSNLQKFADPDLKNFIHGSVNGKNVSADNSMIFSKYKNLKSLNASNNSIRTIAICQSTEEIENLLPNLININLSNNLLKTISGLIYFKNLKILNLSNQQNGIYSLCTRRPAGVSSKIDSGISGPGNSGHQNQQADGNQKNEDVHVTESNTALVNENFLPSNGKINPSPILPNLEILNLANNQIKSVSTLELQKVCPNLLMLFLQNNHLVKLTSGLFGLTKLKCLILDSNRIKDIHYSFFSSCTELKELHLRSYLASCLASLESFVLCLRSARLFCTLFLWASSGDSFCGLFLRVEILG